MRAPHHFFWGNIVLRTPTDAWAVYELEGQSYPGLSERAKIEVGERLEALAYAIEADFQILRVARSFDAEAYVRRATATLDPRFGHRERFVDHLAEHRIAFEQREVLRPEIYLAVRLQGAAGAGPLGGAFDLAAQGWRALAARVGFEEGGGLSSAQIAALRAAEEKVLERVLGYLECRRVGSRQLATLIRRAYTRGLGEPDCDEDFAPQALCFLDAGGEERFEPYGHDLLRLHESRVTIERRSLVIDSERGRGHQAMLVLGAMPEEAVVPGPAAELMFAPLEVGFGVDATLSVEFLPNREARRQVAKRKIDADQIAAEEAAGDHGPSVEGAERPAAARELEAVLGGGDRPPLLRTALSLALGAPSAEELEERIERLRENYGRVQLHRPAGEQHRLFLATLPATPFPLPEYKEHLLPDQVGAMVPHAISHAGSRIGPYIGHTLTGSRSPVLFDLAEGPPAEPPADLPGSPGTSGSGKTICFAAAALAGVPAGLRRRRHRPQGRSPPARAARGRGADRDDRALRRGALRAACSTRCGSGPRRPARTSPTTSSSRSCRRRCARSGRRSCASRSPRRSPPARAPAVRSSAPRGLRRRRRARGRPGGRGPRLQRARPTRASAAAAAELPEVGDAQVVSLRIRNLTLPLPGTARAELLEEERIGLAVLRLLAAYALRLCAADTDRHSVLAMDEAWALTSDTQGRRSAGADQPHGPLAEHHPDPRDPDARRRRRARAAGRRPLRLRRGDRGRGQRGARAAAPRRRRRAGDPAPARLPRRALLLARLRGPGRADADRSAALAAGSSSTRRPPAPGPATVPALSARRGQGGRRRGGARPGAWRSPSGDAAPQRGGGAKRACARRPAGHGEQRKPRASPIQARPDSCDPAYGPRCGGNGCGREAARRIRPGRSAQRPRDRATRSATRAGEIRDRVTRLSCEANGTPESSYPASNYGFDVFIDAGVDAPTGTFAKGFVMILNGLWLGLIFVLEAGLGAARPRLRPQPVRRRRDDAGDLHRGRPALLESHRALAVDARSSAAASGSPTRA